MDRYLIAGVALRHHGPFDAESRLIAEVVLAASEADALQLAAEFLAVEAPLGDGWEGHAVRAAPLCPMEVAYG